MTDERGFTWDHGGHVLFSHYEYFDRLMDDLLGKAWIDHERESWIWLMERFVPYPFQNNIRRLPRRALWECIEGLLNRPDMEGKPRPEGKSGGSVVSVLPSPSADGFGLTVRVDF